MFGYNYAITRFKKQNHALSKATNDRKNMLKRNLWIEWRLFVCGPLWPSFLGSAFFLSSIFWQIASSLDPCLCLTFGNLFDF